MSQHEIHSSSPFVRHAVAEDGDVIADLARRTFRDTFADQNAPADMESYLKRSFSPEQVQIELHDPASTFLLVFAGRDDPPIGYARLKSGEADSSVRGSDPLELERLYVCREAHGRGVGSALMRACLEEAARGDHKTLWLGVWEHNPRAIAFYQRFGFEKVGAHTFLLGSDQQIDIIMERALDERPTSAEAGSLSES